MKADGRQAASAAPKSRAITGGRTSVNQFLREQATLFKQTYVLERRAFETARDGKASTYQPSRRWDGVTTYDADHPDGKTTKNVWQETCRVLLRKHIDPVDYLRRMFSRHSRSKPVPNPDGLLSPECLRNYETGSQLDGIEIALSLRIQQQTARMYVQERATGYKWPTHQAVIDVVLDTDIELSYLFRHCLIANVDHPEVRKFSKLYEVEAAMQYMRAKRFYDESWSQWLPPNFSQTATRIYELLAG